jgi:hypothetical protein
MDEVFRRIDELFDRSGETSSALRHILDSGNLKIVAVEADRGDGRRAHYGAGEQPWDTMAGLGWQPGFAAASILKYLRRSKDPVEDPKKVRWYGRALNELARQERGRGEEDGPARTALRALLGILTQAEGERLLELTRD